ncbi:transport protein Avl9-domain-containing protein [Lasiosphaeria miniovina]|uniref:Transport protein Avl9-domain-containing protein n=1 Tax=Lasiosphaeria miniovina TaxID=1954250 RepID=A0AA39ZQ87_9PEZI|nr:transport protein Avl9-domain-containing protein [Lasiosphaeria miniovina]KAK0701665.1 transport protein Avl9-domain-containing protein [Lasiosphaeria miniovina]
MSDPDTLTNGATPPPPPSERNTAAVENGAKSGGFIPLVSVVDFHHARGPEVEKWFGVDEGSDPAAEYDWALLPFMALSDGAHAATEDFSYFTLLRPATSDAPATSLFGISCTRQMDASQLLVRPAEVTRSTVQKAVVIIADSPQYFGVLRERLSVVTRAWFAQREFTDTEILRRFQESLADEKERGLLNDDEDRDRYLGMSLRELVREFKWQTLVLLKSCLLQPKQMLFFGSRCERLCMMQFSLISLIPGLLRNLQDSAGPELSNYEKKLAKPTSLRTSDRNSLLSYMGLPLQIFGKGSLFGPYTPLQQLDVLADFGTKSYIVGSTNSLLLQQKDRYSDILINLDEDSINITSTSLKAALQLSVSDRRWIDFITQNVNETWDEANPGRTKTMGYVGSEEFIRLQFEEYLLSLISSVKYHNFMLKHANNPKMLLPHIEGDPSLDFSPEFVEAWSRTENYRIWDSHTDSHLFDIVDPKHPCAGGLTIDDVQRRIAQQVQDLHLDERFAQGREVLGRNLAAGREKASTMFNKLYADMEALREAQRKRAEEARLQADSGGQADKNGGVAAAVDLAKAQQTMQAVGVKAGAFVNSWAAWAGEKRKAAGWGRSSGNSDNHVASGAGAAAAAGSGGGGSGGSWASGWVKGSKNRASQASQASGSDALLEKDVAAGSNRLPHISTSSTVTRRSDDTGRSEERALNRGSISGESILDDVSESGLSSYPASPQTRRPPSGGASAPAIDSILSARGDKRGSQNGTAPPVTVFSSPPGAKSSSNSDNAVASSRAPHERGAKGAEAEAEADETEMEPLPPTPSPAAAAAAEAAEVQTM